MILRAKPAAVTVAAYLLNEDKYIADLTKHTKLGPGFMSDQTNQTVCLENECWK